MSECGVLYPLQLQPGFLLRLATKATPNETMDTRPPPTPARVYHLIMAVIIICNKHPTCTIVHSLEVTIRHMKVDITPM